MNWRLVKRIFCWFGFACWMGLVLIALFDDFEFQRLTIAMGAGAMAAWFANWATA